MILNTGYDSHLQKTHPLSSQEKISSNSEIVKIIILRKNKVYVIYTIVAVAQKAFT